MVRYSKVFAGRLAGLLFLGCLYAASAASAQTYVGSNVDERVTVAVQVGAAALQPWLPEGWVPSPPTSGAFEGANLFVIFIDRLLQMDAAGEIAGGGAYRAVGLVAPAKHGATGEAVVFVIRIYGPHEGAGPYKNAVQAEVSRQAALQGTNIGAGSGSETWDVSDKAGGALTLQVEYERAVPVPQSKEQRPYSAVDPDFYRIYRVNQLVDVVMSGPAAIDRVSHHRLSISIGELGAMFDGTEQIVGITVTPSYARQTFLPE